MDRILPKIGKPVRNRTETHLAFILLAGIPLLLSLLVPIERMPSITCGFLALTGYPCPFCGLTRSFWAITAGEWTDAWYHWPFGFCLYGICLLVLIRHTFLFLLGPSYDIWKRRPFSRNILKRIFFVGILLLFFLNWIYRLLRQQGLL